MWLVLILLCGLPAVSQADEPAHEVLAAAPVTTAASNGLSAIHKVLGLTRTQALTPVSDETLLAGAFKGMTDLLIERQRDPHLAIAPDKGITVALFDQRWQALVHQSGVSGADLSAAAIRGMLAVLKDPYTVYMDVREYQGLMEQIDGSNFGGLGLYIEQDERHNHELTVVEPMDDSPAAAAGLKTGDVIVKIDGAVTATMTLDDASKLLRGPEGSPITLTILRAGQSTFDVPMKRAHINMKTVSHKVIDGKIGYVRLRVFGENTGHELEEALQDFDKAHVQAYILDLRNNGGGYINTALEVCSKFLPTGTRVVSVVERDEPEAVYTSLPNIRPHLPLEVLVNKYSASASEITAGCLQDLKAGTLLGTKTFGKGSVQKIFPLNDGTAVKITTAHYHTPSGKDIHHVGIQPDVAADMDPHDMSTEKDTQLTKAVQALETTLAGAPHPQQQTSASPVSATPAGVVALADPTQEYAWLTGHPCDKGGRPFIVVHQKTIELNGKWIDQVTARCPSDGHEQNFLFDVSQALGH
jgi:carboxyl-terminal processing protease